MDRSQTVIEERQEALGGGQVSWKFQQVQVPGCRVVAMAIGLSLQTTVLRISVSPWRSCFDLR